jgi:hypothetical protein
MEKKKKEKRLRKKTKKEVKLVVFDLIEKVVENYEIYEKE